MLLKDLTKVFTDNRSSEKVKRVLVLLAFFTVTIFLLSPQAEALIFNQYFSLLILITIKNKFFVIFFKEPGHEVKFSAGSIEEGY